VCVGISGIEFLVAREESSVEQRYKRTRHLRSDRLLKGVTGYSRVFQGVVEVILAPNTSYMSGGYNTSMHLRVKPPTEGDITSAFDDAQERSRVVA